MPHETILKPCTSGAKRLNILAVDDEAGSRAALAVVLKLAGHHAFTAKDAEEALELFDKAQAPFDLIITDHQMVRRSGLDLVRSLRAKGFAGEIVVLTAYAEEIDQEEYKKLVVAGIMKKPFDLTVLRQWIDWILGCCDQSRTGDKPPCPDACWLRPE